MKTSNSAQTDQDIPLKTSSLRFGPHRKRSPLLPRRGWQGFLRYVPESVCALLVTLLVISCGNKGTKKAESGASEFPFPEVPAMMTDQAEIASYVATHFWNKFFTDPQKYYNAETFPQIFSQYASLIISAPPAIIERAQDSLLDKAERAQVEYPDFQILAKIFDLQESYFYDPNSPLRNEECCLPYLRKITTTSVRDEAARQKAAHELPLFALNRIGTPAADFEYTLKNGRTGTLHSVKAERILLFFSNPGCHNCKEIIDALSANDYVQQRLADGSLKVLNVYPDEDLGEWYAYMSHYPKEWINAYDANLILHSNTIYNIRAIPSIYILDAQKNVLCKDAPLDVALNYLYQ